VVESPALTVIVLLTWISVDDRRAVRRWRPLPACGDRIRPLGM